MCRRLDSLTFWMRSPAMIEVPVSTSSNWPAAPATTFSPSYGTVALNLGAAVSFFALGIVAVAFDWVALKGVLVVGFLSVALAYLVLPLVRVIRRVCAVWFRGWRPSRILAVLMIYASVAIIVAPIWAIWGEKIVSQVPDVAREVPRQVSRFISQVRASERWHERFAFERETRVIVRATTLRVSERLQAEVAEVGAEVLRARRVAPATSRPPLLRLLPAGVQRREASSRAPRRVSRVRRRSVRANLRWLSLAR